MADEISQPERILAEDSTQMMRTDAEVQENRCTKGKFFYLLFKLTYFDVTPSFQRHGID
jgi:hypothetical protein